MIASGFNESNAKSLGDVFIFQIQHPFIIENPYILAHMELKACIGGVWNVGVSLHLKHQIAAVATARARQGVLNQQLQGQALDACANADPAALQLQNAATKLGWSARGIHRTLRVACTIADLAQSTAISTAHVGEAVQYRRALMA